VATDVGAQDPVAIGRAVAARTARLREAAPEVMGGFARMHVAARQPGALTTPAKELMALAISIAVHCEGCIAVHLRDALAAGATRDEVVEAIGMAVLMGGGPAVVLGGVALDQLDELAPDAP
jgi:AhpD family alkylhydroperoxidase